MKRNRLTETTILFIAIITLLASCTKNQRARTFGGTETINLLPNEEFINITWKESDLWIIVKDTTTGIFYAREKSSFGVMQGKIIIATCE